MNASVHKIISTGYTDNFIASSLFFMKPASNSFPRGVSPWGEVGNGSNGLGTFFGSENAYSIMSYKET